MTIKAKVITIVLVLITILGICLNRYQAAQYDRRMILHPELSDSAIINHSGIPDSISADTVDRYAHDSN